MQADYSTVSGLSYLEYLTIYVEAPDELRRARVELIIGQKR